MITYPYTLGKGAWSPENLDTIVWLDATDASTITSTGDLVDTWADKSGNGNDVTALTTDRPDTGTRQHNGLNVIDFDGSTFLENISIAIPTSGDISIFQVTKIDVIDNTADGIFSMNSATFDFQFDSGGATTFDGIVKRGGAVNAVSSNGPYHGPSTYLARFDQTNNSTVTAWYDGTEDGTTPYGAGEILSTPQDLRIMANRTDAQRIDGWVGETIIIEDASAGVRRRVEGYLAWKWGLVSKLPSDHPYKENGSLFGFAWSPLNASPSLWLDANDSFTMFTDTAGTTPTSPSGGLIARWNDKSDNDNDVTQSTAGDRATLQTDRVDFVDGDHLTKVTQNNMLDASGDHTLIMVHDIFDPTTSSGAFINILQNFSTETNPTNRRPTFFYTRAQDIINHSYNSTSGSNITASSFVGKSIVAGRVSGTDNELIINGTIEDTVTVTSTSSITASALNIGDNNNQDLTISFNEVIYLSGNASVSDRQKVEGYLAHKWGLEGDLPSVHPYKNAAP